ncbi:MAG: DUF255 domain-containing protein [Saprospiraceae bacterium]|nr:DUF255 domain-containing protein [Saprospiraceae bacterium]
MRLQNLICLLLIVGLTACNESTSDSNTTPENTADRSHPAAKAKQQNAVNDHMKTGDLQWLTFEQAANMKNKGSKKYLVDVYTDWCGWCKVMDKKTFTDPEVQKYLDENFHVIKFNAEQKEAIDFKGKKYEWLPAGRRGVNMLAMELLGSRLSYPTLVYLDENMNKIKSSPGFKKPDQLMSELRVISGS